MLRKKNNGKVYYVTAHYDVIYYIHIYHRSKRHFEEIVDSDKVINDVIICIDIIHFPVIFSKHKFQLFIYNLRYINEDDLLKSGEVIVFLNDSIYTNGQTKGYRIVYHISL